MDTLLILRDTISADVVILRDTIITNVVKVIDSCQPCVQEAETNCNDVIIVVIICLALCIVSCLGICKFFELKKEEREDKKTTDTEKRKNDVDDRIWKQQSDLIEKLLDFLKNEASKKDDNKGKQANDTSLSMKDEDVYKLLKGNAAKSCSEDLRQRYIELCVEILQKLKVDKNTSINGNNAGNTQKDNSGDASQSKSPSDIYKNVLCSLIGLIHKDKLEDKDIQALNDSCK